jgi:hypothetical protein
MKQAILILTAALGLTISAQAGMYFYNPLTHRWEQRPDPNPPPFYGPSYFTPDWHYEPRTRPPAPPPSHHWYDFGD